MQGKTRHMVTLSFSPRAESILRWLLPPNYHEHVPFQANPTRSNTVQHGLLGKGFSRPYQQPSVSSLGNTLGNVARTRDFDVCWCLLLGGAWPPDSCFRSMMHWMLSLFGLSHQLDLSTNCQLVPTNCGAFTKAQLQLLKHQR